MDEPHTKASGCEDEELTVDLTTVERSSKTVDKHKVTSENEI